MKRNIILLAIIASSLSTYGQNELDVYKLSRNDLSGTARSVSMGGAFGALGGDMGAVSINPAGIGIYRSSEFVATLDFQNVNAKTSLTGGYDMKDNRFNLSFSNLGYVASVAVDNEDVPRINFGFAYNKLKNFNKKYRTGGGEQSYSLTDYIAAKTYGVSKSDLGNSITSDGSFDPPTGTPWLSALAYNSYLINYTGIDGDSNPYYSSLLPSGQTVVPWLDVDESGSIDKYDFTVGTTIDDQLSVGLTLSVTDISYNMYSNYEEDIDANNFYYLENWLNTDGSGFQFNLGLIYKPVNSLRLGLSYQSPTWYSMTDQYSASITDQVDDYAVSGYSAGITSTGGGYVDYNMRTPDRWTFSVAGVIGQTAILSADYELTNYKNMQLSDDNDQDWTDNQKMFIKEDFKPASTLRLGAEVRFTPQFSGRVGYMWQQSPLVAEFKDGNTYWDNTSQGIGEQMVNNSTLTNYTLEGDANYFTYGLGYRFSRGFYTDVAFVMKSQKAELYPFSDLEFSDGSTLGVVPSELKMNTFSGLLTLGFKF